MPVNLELEYSIRRVLIQGVALSETALTLVINRIFFLSRTQPQVHGALGRLKSEGLASSGPGLAHYSEKTSGKVKLATKEATLYYSTELPLEKR
jgi:hypothetical protein